MNLYLILFIDYILCFYFVETMIIKYDQQLIAWRRFPDEFHIKSLISIEVCFVLFFLENPSFGYPFPILILCFNFRVMQTIVANEALIDIYLQPAFISMFSFLYLKISPISQLAVSSNI